MNIKSLTLAVALSVAPTFSVAAVTDADLASAQHQASAEMGAGVTAMQSAADSISSNAGGVCRAQTGAQTLLKEGTALSMPAAEQYKAAAEVGNRNDVLLGRMIELYRDESAVLQIGGLKPETRIKLLDAFGAPGQPGFAETPLGELAQAAGVYQSIVARGHAESHQQQGPKVKAMLDGVEH